MNQNYRVILCYNSVTLRHFQVNSVQDVGMEYMKNFYHLKLRLNFSEDTFPSVTEMAEVSVQKICHMMTDLNMWQRYSGFYVVDYEVQSVPLEIQNFNEFDSDDDDSLDADFAEIDVSDEDSAYDSPTSPAAIDNLVNEFINSLIDLVESDDDGMMNVSSIDSVIVRSSSSEFSDTESAISVTDFEDDTSA